MNITSTPSTVLYFGSFNPFHIGHAALAKYVAALPWVDEVWFVLSPKNPLKESNALQDPIQRWKDLQRVVEKLNKEDLEQSEKEMSKNVEAKKSSDSGRDLEGKVLSGKRERFYACDAEFELQPPLYTYNTLEHLSNSYPERNFAILMGGDNIEILHKWHKGEEIASKYTIIVYPREGAETQEFCKKYGAIYIDAPQIDVSSSQIRQMAQNGQDVSSLRY